MGKQAADSSAASSRPVVSVVVPVYNCEEHLRQCLDSLLGQTLSDLELICVDDGSTDSAPRILAEYAAADSRVRVITQENSGPGHARNVGMDKAVGEYLYFFDCDDWCEPELLELACARANAMQADLVALPHTAFDQRVGEAFPVSWALLPEKYPADVCSWRDNPDWLFRAFQNYPWNKILRTDFVRENGLHFQEDIRLTEDLMFSAPALVRARRMTFLPETLVHHREGTGKNAMAAKDLHPLDFIEAFRSLRGFLEAEGVYDDLRIAYENWAIDGIIYNISTLNTYEGFMRAYEALMGDAEGAAGAPAAGEGTAGDGADADAAVGEGAAVGTETGALFELGLADVPAHELQEPRFAEFLRRIKGNRHDFLYWIYVDAREERDLRGSNLAVEYRHGEEYRRTEERIRRECDDARDEIERLRAQLAETQDQLDALRGQHETLQREFNEQMGAAEQKVGQALCWIPRRIQEQIIKKNNR